MFMPPKEKNIILPEGGWKESTWYLVDVAFNQHNPIHRALFYTGFLNGSGTVEGIPGGYNTLIPINGGNDPHKLQDVHYMNPIKIVLEKEEADRGD